MATSTLTYEIQRRLEILFKHEDRTEASRLLSEECGNSLPLLKEATPQMLNRIRFAALKMSGGNLSELRKALETAKNDWRDLLTGAGFGHDAQAHERWMPDSPVDANDKSSKSALIDILHRTSDQIRPLTDTSEAGWEDLIALDGTPLRPKLHWRDVAARTPSRLAVEWHTRLVTVADLLHAQDGCLSPSQVSYLRKMLCGGDKSLNGVSFDSTQFGDIAIITNKALIERREEFEAFFAKLGVVSCKA